MDRYTAIILAALELSKNENAELKKQNETLKLQNISSAVATLTDEWLNKPYECGRERQDIEEFAEKITKYIHNQLKL